MLMRTTDDDNDADDDGISNEINTQNNIIFIQHENTQQA